MHTLIRAATFFLLTTVAFNAQAGLRQLGTDFRTMMSNYTMINELQQRCPDISLLSIKPKPHVERAMQNKLGIENYIQLQISINKSDDKKSALATIDKLWQSIEGCQDPKLDAALQRIATVHGEAFARLEAEPGLVKAKDVPVPMRR